MFGFLQRWWSLISPPRRWLAVNVTVSLRTHPSEPIAPTIPVDNATLVTTLQKLLEVHDEVATVFQQCRDAEAEVIGRKMWDCLQAIHIQGYDAEVRAARQLLREHQQQVNADARVRSGLQDND